MEIGDTPSGRVVIEARFTAPGGGPAGLAWDGANLWHADSRDGRIYALDPATAAPRRSLYCPGNLSGLTWDGHSLWQSLFDQETIRCVNPETNDFDRAIILEGQGWLSGVAWDGRDLWAAAQQHGRLLAVDPTTGRSRPPLPAPAAMGDIDYYDGALWAGVAEPMRFDGALRRFEWLEGTPAFAVVRLDPATGRETARYAAERLYSGLCWAGGALWLADRGGRELVRARLEIGV